jgi:hypothetical protein
MHWGKDGLLLLGLLCFFFFCCRVIFVNSHTQSEGPQILISQEDPDLIFRPVKMKKKLPGDDVQKANVTGDLGISVQPSCVQARQTRLIGKQIINCFLH